MTSPITPDTAPNNAVVKDSPEVTDKRLDTRNIAITSAAAQLSFRNNFNLQDGFDGGVLEVSSPNIAGGAFTDITNPAVGGSFVAGGYTDTISLGLRQPDCGPHGVVRQFGWLHQHRRESGTERKGTNDQAAVPPRRPIEPWEVGGWRIDTLSITAWLPAPSGWSSADPAGTRARASMLVLVARVATAISGSCGLACLNPVVLARLPNLEPIARERSERRARATITTWLRDRGACASRRLKRELGANQHGWA